MVHRTANCAFPENRHPPVLIKKTETGFCIWHQDCKKIDWEPDLLAERAFMWSEVDGPGPATYDMTGVPPLRKVPCTYHVQKNAVGRLIDALHSLHGRDNKELNEWIKAQKWGMVVFSVSFWHVHHPLGPPQPVSARRGRRTGSTCSGLIWLDTAIFP